MRFLSPDKFSLMETDLDIDADIPKNSAPLAFTSAPQAEYRILPQRGRCTNTSLIICHFFFQILLFLTTETLLHSQTLLSFFWSCRNMMVHQNFNFLIINSTHLSAPFHRWQPHSEQGQLAETISKFIILSFISVINQHIFCLAEDAKQPWQHPRFLFQKFSVARVMLTGSQLTPVPSKYNDEYS